jgi:flagellar hook-basal body complex protein FliE
VTAPIGPIGAPPAVKPEPAGNGVSAPGSAAGFGDSLARLMNTVETSSESANQAVEHMLNGTGDVHEAMIALQRAELTLQFTVQVRNKLVQAYQDIMRMPV